MKNQKSHQQLAPEKVKTKDQKSGYAVITTVIFFLIISIAVISAVVVPTTNQIKSVRDAQKSKQSYLAADNVNEDALYRLNLGKTLPSTLSLPFSNGSTAVAQVTTVGNQKRVLTTGTYGTTVRYAETYYSSEPAATIQYAAQIGSGGIYLTGGSYISGDVYSNGSITTDSSSPYITGSASVANAAPAAINQTNSAATPISLNTATTTATTAAGGQDLAQSFRVTSTVQLTSIRLYVKKTVAGSPSNATIRIMPDNGGKPSHTGSLGSGTLNASSVTTSFTYVSIPISQVPSLTVGTTYWIVIDNPTPTNPVTKYYTFGGTGNTYTNGVAKYGYWSSSNGQNNWSTNYPANTDLYFDIYLGGIPNTIAGSGQYNRIRIGTSGTGDAWANQINSASISGTSYCQSGTYLYNLNNATKTCDVSRGDPPQLAYPITDENITTWKAVAATGGTSSGNYTVSGGTTVVLGPKKISGNLVVTGGSTLSLTGTVWVTGNIDLGGGSIIKLASSYGTTDGMIIADGQIGVTGGSYMQGSGTSGSYMVAMTTSQCPTTGSCNGPGSPNAASVDGGSGSVVVFAPYGTLSLSGGGALNSAIANRLLISGGSYVNYNTSINTIDFLTSTTTPGSASNWNIDSWTEVSQ